MWGWIDCLVDMFSFDHILPDWTIIDVLFREKSICFVIFGKGRTRQHVRTPQSSATLDSPNPTQTARSSVFSVYVFSTFAWLQTTMSKKSLMWLHSVK